MRDSRRSPSAEQPTMNIKSVNPATGETIKSYPPLRDAEVNEIVGRVHEAFLAWRGASMAERAQRLRTVAAVLRERAREWGELMAREMGKPVRDGVAEAQKCALCCEYFAENAGQFLAPQTMASDARKSFVTFKPLGVVLAVMPWNFPFWQVFRFAA